MTDPTQAPQTALSAANTLSADMMCLSCGYNLRGLTHKGNCPECGLEIERTIIARQGMTKRELAALAFRITALWIFLGSITGLVSTWGYLIDSLFQIVIAIFWAGVSVVLTAILWWKAEYLARRAIVEDGPLLLGGRIVPEQVMSIAFGIIGMLNIIRAITGAGWAAATVLTGMNDTYSRAYLMTAALNLVIGCVLIIGAGRIASMVMWLRTAGTNTEK